MSNSRHTPNDNKQKYDYQYKTKKVDKCSKILSVKR